MCGENCFFVVCVFVCLGSSPRVRGKLPGSPPCGGAGGLIPACAGKTLSPKPQTLNVPAHPRVCGENSSLLPPPYTLTGSSPRVRGKLWLHKATVFIAGLIPACAGKTRCRDRSSLISRAHPRVCGENMEGFLKKHPEKGSSPRVRGKPHYNPGLQISSGLIPACAGKTE